VRVNWGFAVVKGSAIDKVIVIYFTGLIPNQIAIQIIVIEPFLLKVM
jgi:hypothetical protein